MPKPVARWVAIMVLGIAVGLVLTPGRAEGQSSEQRIDRKIAIDADASIRIYNLTGSVRVEGWDRDTLSVTGTVSDPAKNRFFIGGFQRGAKLGIEAPLELDQAPAYLIVRVPTRARVWIKAATASVTLIGLKGGIDVSSTSGNLQFEGDPDQLSLETMDGNIDINATGTWIRAKTASGTITLRGTGEDVGATTVSGNVSLLSTGMRRARVESVSGEIAFSGSLTRDGELTIESHSGSVNILLPTDFGAEFDLSTYQGRIRNEFRPDRLPIAHGAGQELHFMAAEGGANVTVQTFKGTIVLRGK
jgi:hypothetical protein